VGFDATDQLLIKYLVLVRYWRNKREYYATVHQLLADFKRASDSVRREVLCNVLVASGSSHGTSQAD
jgi:hypothetical protein